MSRQGGDEFVLLIHPLGDTPQQAVAGARAVADTVLRALRQPFVLGGEPYTVTTSIGVVLFRGMEESAEQLLKRADQAMYLAKAAGRNQAHVDEEGSAA